MTLRWTPEDLERFQSRGVAQAARVLEERSFRGVKLASPKKAGQKPGKRGMNQWETAFSESLEARKQSGELIWWAFEPFRIKLANDCWYRPDFVTVDKHGRTEVFEVKGHMREAARVRLKVAIEKLPYPFYLVRKDKGRLKVTPV